MKASLISRLVQRVNENLGNLIRKPTPSAVVTLEQPPLSPTGEVTGCWASRVLGRVGHISKENRAPQPSLKKASWVVTCSEPRQGLHPRCSPACGAPPPGSPAHLQGRWARHGPARSESGTARRFSLYFPGVEPRKARTELNKSRVEESWPLNFPSTF